MHLINVKQYFQCVHSQGLKSQSSLKVDKAQNLTRQLYEIHLIIFTELLNSLSLERQRA